MKRRILAMLMAGALALAMTACGGNKETDQQEVAELDTISESSEVESTAEESEEATDVQQGKYNVTLENQEISYMSPGGTTELVSASLQKLTLSGSDSDAIDKINENFEASYNNTLDMISHTSSDNEGDLVNGLSDSAYEHYSFLETDGNTDYFTPYYLGCAYSAQRVDDTVFSSQSTTTMYLGGAHGSNILSGVNYDMRTGDVILLSDLSDDAASFNAFVKEKLIAQADEMQEKEQLFFQEYRENIEYVMTDNTFYFSQEGLCFISQEYVLQPYAAGTIEFCIPYDELKGQIKDEYFPTEVSWDFGVTEISDEPITITYQLDFASDIAGPMLNSFLDWSGYLYFYGENISFDALTPEAVMSIAGRAVIYDHAYDESWSKEMTEEDICYYGYAIPADLLDTYMKNYFGKTYDVSAFESDDRYPMVKPLEDGSLLVCVGDWGLVQPKYVITDCVENEDNSYTVAVDYFQYDYEEDSNSDVCATAVYTFTPNNDSKFGYVITDMQFTQKAE